VRATVVAAGALGTALLGGCGDEPGTEQLTVFAAASLAGAFEEIAAELEAREGIDVVLSFGASSSLREQILGGAPADVFASAGPGPMAALVDAGEVAGEPVTFARNRLEIAVPAGNPGEVTALDDLSDEDLLVGICAPEVPCGALARTVLAEAGVAVRPDTEEPDVRALLTKVVAGELDAGLVYVTDVLAAGDDVEGIAVPGGATTEYPIAVVGRSGAGDAAGRFVALVLGPEGQRILADAGFEAP